MPGAAAADRRLLMEVEKGNLSGVKKLLVGGANVNGSSELEFRPITSAARTGNATMLKLLISRGADLEAQARLPEGARALHAAIAGEKVDALRVLLDAGADVNSRDGDGLTPLMQTPLAATNGAEMAQTLLNNLADPFVKNNNGMTALHVAAGLGGTRVMGVILAHSPAALNKLADGFTPLGIAALKGEKRAVSFLLDAGASDKGVHPDQAAIFWAAEGAHPSMMRLMLDYPIESTGGLGAIPNAMGVAIQGREAKMVDMLMSVEGEDKRRKWAECSLKGGYPLHLACAWVSHGAVHVLLSAGANEAHVNRGHVASQSIGQAMNIHMRNAETEAGLRRMLERGPAFRARSFAWTAQMLADGGGGAATATSSRLKAAGALGVNVNVYRPMGTRLFATRFARYVKK